MREKIDPRYLLLKIVKILEHLEIPYLITGGIAVLMYGRPRFTADIDIVVELQERHIGDLGKNLRKLSDTGYISESEMREALFRQGEFNYIDSNTGMKVDFWILKNDAFDRSRLKRKIAMNVLRKRIYFSSPEDLILMKLVWHNITPSDRQLDDVRSILKISGKKLDTKYLKKWAKTLKTLKTLKELMKP